MLIYEFKALTNSGHHKQGTVKARNLERAKRRVQDKGLFISSIELNEKVKSQSSTSIFNLILELFLFRTNKMEL